jgi:hypothetical protein
VSDNILFDMLFLYFFMVCLIVCSMSFNISIYFKYMLSNEHMSVIADSAANSTRFKITCLPLSHPYAAAYSTSSGTTVLFPSVDCIPVNVP